MQHVCSQKETSNEVGETNAWKHHASELSKCSFRFPSRIPPRPEEGSQWTFNGKEGRKDAISNNEKPEMDLITKRWNS